MRNFYSGNVSVLWKYILNNDGLINTHRYFYLNTRHDTFYVYSVRFFIILVFFRQFVEAGFYKYEKDNLLILLNVFDWTDFSIPPLIYFSQLLYRNYKIYIYLKIITLFFLNLSFHNILIVRCFFFFLLDWSNIIKEW